jgi:Protein of unknown function (DUF1207)
VCTSRARHGNWCRCLARLVAAALLALGSAVPCALAGDAPDAPDAAAGKPGGWEFFPEAGFYPLYIADPIRPQSALMVVRVPSSEIPDTGAARFVLRLGGQFPIFAHHPDGKPDCGWQLDFEGGWSSHFDIGHALDNIGWDGLFGLLLDYKPRPALAFRFGTRHDSAHVGDEYTERTGRERVGYTREEVVLGVSALAARRWRYYVEVGYQPGPQDFQKPLRAQAGVEYQGDRPWPGARAGWYAALDLQAYEENDWHPRATAQLGINVPTGRGHSRYRFALEGGTGRSALGEFFTASETYFGIGWYFDF